MPTRRLEDRIRELCARALYERDPQWSATLAQLQLYPGTLTPHRQCLHRNRRVGEVLDHRAAPGVTISIDRML
jgi:hypothetical protein